MKKKNFRQFEEKKINLKNVEKKPQFTIKYIMREKKKYIKEN